MYGSAKARKPTFGVKHIRYANSIEKYIQGLEKLSKRIIPTKSHIEDTNNMCENNFIFLANLEM
jgi:hypothetical protein